MKIMMKKKVKNKFIKKIKQTKLIYILVYFKKIILNLQQQNYVVVFQRKIKMMKKKVVHFLSKILKDFEQFLYIHTKTFNMEQKKK